MGIGRTAFTRESGRTTRALAVEASRLALEDAGLLPSDIDGVISYSTGDSAGTADVAGALGVEEHRWALDLFGGGNVAVEVVATAMRAVEAGACNVALVYRSLNGRSGYRYGAGEAPLSVGGEAQFSAPHGYMTPAHHMAMWARRHQHIYGSTSEDLGEIAIVQRRHAAKNEQAIARKAMDMGDYLSGRWIADPLRVYDCCQEVDGAVALVVTTAERARDLRHRPVVACGHSQSWGHGGTWDQWPDMTVMYSVYAGPRLWQASGLSPSDVDVACMYDCFTYTVMATMEDFGFCGKGEVGDFFREGRATYGGDVVVNPHGGLLSEGYIHGLNHHYEAVLQLRGLAEHRQVPGADVALVTAGAGPYGGALLLRASDTNG